MQALSQASDQYDWTSFVPGKVRSVFLACRCSLLQSDLGIPLVSFACRSDVSRDSQHEAHTPCLLLRPLQGARRRASLQDGLLEADIRGRQQAAAMRRRVCAVPEGAAGPHQAGSAGEHDRHRCAGMRAW